MIDGHMHLEYGDLNKEYVLKFVDAAVKKGLTKIQILDHTHRFKEFEEIYTELKEEPLQKKWLENKAMKFKDTLDDYDKLIEEVKALDLPIEVTFGLEVCYVPKHEKKIGEVLANHNYDFVVEDLIIKSNTGQIEWDTYTDIKQCPLYDNLYEYYYVSELSDCDTYEIYIYPYMDGYILITASIYKEYGDDITVEVKFIIIPDKKSEPIVHMVDTNKTYKLWNILHLKYFGEFDKDKSDELIRNYVINESFKENSNYEITAEKPTFLQEDTSSYSAFNDSDIENLQEVITKLEDKDVRDLITQIYDNKTFIKRMLAYYTRFQKLNKSKSDKE